MITLTVKKVARAKAGVRNAYELMNYLGCSYSVASRLWNGKPLPRLITLDGLAATFGCEITELYRWTPGTRKPLTAVKRSKARVEVG